MRPDHRACQALQDHPARLGQPELMDRLDRMDRTDRTESPVRKAFQGTMALTAMLDHPVRKAISASWGHKDKPAKVELTAQPGRKATLALADRKDFPVSMATMARMERPGRQVLPVNLDHKGSLDQMDLLALRESKDRRALTDWTASRDLLVSRARMERPDFRDRKERLGHKAPRVPKAKPDPLGRKGRKVQKVTRALRDRLESVVLKVRRVNRVHPGLRVSPLAVQVGVFQRHM